MNLTVTCPKCQEVFTTENPPKQLINCHHVLCLSCLNAQILCPIDRKRIERRRHKIQSFQTREDILQFILKPSPSNEQVTKEEEEQQIKQQVLSSAIHSNAELIGEFLVEQNKVTQWQEAQAVPELAISIQEEQAFIPKYQDIKFQTCLLHSRSADIICLKDKCLICSNCGLFGQHKNHDLLPYDIFVANYTTLLEQTYNNFDLLKKSQEKISQSIIQEEIVALVKQKRELQIRNIKKYIANLIATIKSTEKIIINQLDATLKEKQQKILKELTLQTLQNRINEYYGQIQKITQGSIDIYKLQKIDRYIGYADENNPKSYINKEGEYLIAEVDSYTKTLRNKMKDWINQFEYKCSDKLNEAISNCFELVNKGNPKVQEKANKDEIKIKIKLEAKKDSPKIDSPITLRRGKQEDLLINSRSNQERNKNNVRDMSPIQPIPKFDQKYENSFKHSYNSTTLVQNKQECFLNVKEVTLNNCNLYVPHHKKNISFVNKSLNSLGIRNHDGKKDNQIANQIKYHGKINSNNSSHIVEREILSVLDGNKKKKKLDLPQKYAKTYEELQKDKVDILDLGGAGLGDQIVLSISQLFETRNRLKSAKLMNNKISDDIFPDLLFRCRHLTSINLSYNNLSEKSLEWLERQSEYLGNLANITMSNNKIVLRNVKDRIENLRKKGIKVSL